MELGTKLGQTLVAPEPLVERGDDDRRQDPENTGQRPHFRPPENVEL